MNKLGTKINLEELFQELDKDRNDVIDYNGKVFHTIFQRHKHYSFISEYVTLHPVIFKLFQNQSPLRSGLFLFKTFF